MTTSFPVLDLILGLIFIFFLLSIIASAAVELILSFFNLRARELARWLYMVLDKPALNAAGFYYDQEDNCYRQNEDGSYEPVIVATTHGEQTAAAMPFYIQKNGRAYELKLAPASRRVTTTTGNREEAGVKPAKKTIKLVSLGQSIMDHCAATALSSKGKSPTYIGARTFVASLLEKITLDPSQPGSIPNDIQEFQSAIEASPLLSHELKRTILMLANEAADEAKAAGTALLNFRVKLEAWYDAATDRISGDLKRKWVMPFTLAIAILITVWVNADVVAISKFLYSNKEARTALANTAQNAIDTARYQQAVDRIRLQMEAQLQANPQDTTAKNGLQQIREASDNFYGSIADLQSKMPQGLPLGPDIGAQESVGNYINRHWEGWLCSILAISLGAPFWFDLLNKIANLRGTGPKPASATDVERKLASTDKK